MVTTRFTMRLPGASTCLERIVRLILVNTQTVMGLWPLLSADGRMTGSTAAITAVPLATPVEYSWQQDVGNVGE